MALAFIAGYTPSRRSNFSRKSNKRMRVAENGTLRFIDFGATQHWTIDAVYELITETEKETLVDWLHTNEDAEIDYIIGGDTYTGYIDPRKKITASPVGGSTWTVRFSFYGVKQ